MKNPRLPQLYMVFLAITFTACGDPKEDCLAAASEWDASGDFADSQCSQSDECAKAIVRNIDDCKEVLKATGQKDGVFICAATAASLDGDCD